MDIEELVQSLQTLSGLTARLERLEGKVDLLVAATPTKEFISVSDICLELDCSRDYIRRRLWILPAFGVPDLPGRPRRWKVESWQSWKQDLPAREQAWRAMPEAERQRISKAAA